MLWVNDKSIKIHCTLQQRNSNWWHAGAFILTLQKSVDMKPPYEVDLFKVSRALLQFMGETHERTPKHIILFRICNSIILFYIAAFIIVNFFHVSGGNYIETTQSLISIVHVRINDKNYIDLLFLKNLF